MDAPKEIVMKSPSRLLGLSGSDPNEAPAFTGLSDLSTLLPSVEEMKKHLAHYAINHPRGYLEISRDLFARHLLYEGLEERMALIYRAVQRRDTDDAMASLELLHQWYRDRMAYGGQPHDASLQIATDRLNPERCVPVVQ